MEPITRREAKSLGLKSYFTGVPCKQGHVDKRRVADGACRECGRLASNRWKSEGTQSDYQNDWKETPPADFLHECFSYDPETGKVYWKHRPASHFKREPDVRTFNTTHAGNEVGYLNYANGYIVVNFQNKLYKLHRIIYKMVVGEDAGDVLDHINGDRADNRWSNLQVISQQENIAKRSF